mgnify:CR=1 FL=1
MTLRLKAILHLQQSSRRLTELAIQMIRTKIKGPLRADSSHPQPGRIGASLTAPGYVGSAQEATFAKFAFRPGNTALDRCGAA